ncbi:MAG TPA: shikimate dehydrogenase [Allosphingosinicella sp.]|jgi:shikimate dehydrogenase
MGVPFAEVIGDPVAFSKSPAIHGHWLAQMGIEGHYRATRVTAPELPSYLAERCADPDWRGCNVTMPLKQAVAEHLDDVNPIARRIGAVNTIVRYDEMLCGLNTDWIGVNLALMQSLEGKDTVVIGAGGAARAVLEELRQAKPQKVTIMNRSQDKAAALLDRFGLEGEVRPLGAAPPADLLVNASPLGMAGHPELEVDISALRPGAIVFDLVYHPLETALLRTARAAGLRTLDGLDMLVCQASMAFTHFFGAPPEPMWTPELRELLAR